MWAPLSIPSFCFSIQVSPENADDSKTIEPELQHSKYNYWNDNWQDTIDVLFPSAIDIKNAVKSRNDRRNSLIDMRKYFKFNKEGQLNDVIEYIDHRNEKAESLFYKLNNTLQKRIDIHNKNPNHTRTKSYVSLPRSKKEMNKLISSLETIEENDLLDAFIVLADEVIRGTTKVKHGMVSYLLKEVDGEYPVLNDYILKFLCNYGEDKY